MYSKWKFTHFPYKFVPTYGTIRTSGSERISQDILSFFYFFFLGYSEDNHLGISKQLQSPYGIGG